MGEIWEFSFKILIQETKSLFSQIWRDSIKIGLNIIEETLEESDKEMIDTFNKTAEVNYNLRINIEKEVKVPTKEKIITNIDNREMKEETKTINISINTIESKV